MTEPLSPAAQAVWDAFNQDEAGVFVDYGDCLAAALRAVADQAYEVPAYIRGDDYLNYRNGVEAERSRILAIAAELGAQP